MLYEENENHAAVNLTIIVLHTLLHNMIGSSCYDYNEILRLLSNSNMNSLDRTLQPKGLHQQYDTRGKRVVFICIFS